MHKCIGCSYSGTYDDGKFMPIPVCTREHDIARAAIAYMAESCPFDNKDDPPLILPGQIDMWGETH